MTPEEAKFLLASYRPDGQDATDEAFREALDLATKDQELGEWFAREMKRDASFSQAVSTLDVPVEMKSEICRLMDGAVPNSQETTLDVEFHRALSTIVPRAELKREILLAMQVESDVQYKKAEQPKKWAFSKYAFPLAAAALVFIGVFLNFYPIQGNQEALKATYARAKMDTLSALVNVSGGSGYGEADYAAQHRETTAFEVNDLPGKESLPVLLQDSEVLKCQPITVDGRDAGLLCYQTDSLGVVHLVVFDLEKEECGCKSVPRLCDALESYHHCEISGYSIAEWQNEQQGYILLGKLDNKAFKEIF